MKIAVIGCLHGCFEKAYKTIQEAEIQDQSKVDLVLCCGDLEVKCYIY